VAALHGHATVRVELDDDDAAPGLVFFAFELDGGGDAGVYGSGIMAGDEVLVGFDRAGPTIARALAGTSDAAVLARAFGVLETECDTARALVAADQLADVPADSKAYVGLPTLVDGPDARVLTYWCESGEPPLFRSTVTIEKSGKVTRQRKDIWSFLQS